MTDLEGVMHFNVLRGNPKTWVSPDRTETSPGSGHIFENIFGLGRVGDKDFGPVRVGVFFYQSIIFFPRISKKKVELNENHASHFQPE